MEETKADEEDNTQKDGLIDLNLDDDLLEEPEEETESADDVQRKDCRLGMWRMLQVNLI